MIVPLPVAFLAALQALALEFSAGLPPHRFVEAEVGAGSIAVAPAHGDGLAVAREALEDVRTAGNPEAGRAAAEGVLAALADRELDDEAGEVLWELALAARELGALEPARTALERLHAHGERTLAPEDDDLLDVQSELVSVWYELGEEARACDLFEQVVAVLERQAPPDDEDLRQNREDLARLQVWLGRDEGARVQLLALHESNLRVLAADDLELFEIWDQLILTLIALGDVETAEAELDACAAALGALPADDALRARFWVRLIADAIDIGDLQRALDIALAAFDVQREVLPPDDPDLILTAIDAASFHINLDQPSRGAELLESLLEEVDFAELEDGVVRLRYWATLAKALVYAGRTERAREVGRVAVAGLEEVPLDPGALRWRAMLAEALLDVGAHDVAVEFLESSLEEVERSLPESLFGIASLRAILAAAAEDTGNLLGARAMREAAEEEFAASVPESDWNRSENRWRLAITIAQLGDETEAVRRLEDILADLERDPAAGPRRLLDARWVLAVNRHNLGDYAGARVLLEDLLASPGLDPHDRLLFERTLATTLYGMGERAAGRARMEEVLARHDAAPPGVSRPGERLLVLLSLVEFAETTEAKRAYLQEALSMLPPDHERARSNRMRYAHLLEGNDTELLLEEFGAWIAELAAREPSSSGTLIQNRGSFAKACARAGRDDLAREQALAIARGLLDGLREAARFDSQIARSIVHSKRYERDLVRALADGQEDAILRFELAETCRAVAGASTLPGAVSSPLAAELAELRVRLNDLVMGGAGHGARSAAVEVSRLSRERDRLERRLRAEGGADSRHVRLAEVAESLGEDAAAVGFLRVRPLDERFATTAAELVAHVVLSDGTLVELSIGPASEIEELVNAWRAALRAPLERGFVGAEPTDAEPAAGALLRARVLDPILAAVGDRSTLHVCLDDVLHLVPLDALPLGEGGGRVGDRFRIVNESSFTRLVADRPRPQGELSLLAVGGVAYGRASSPGPSGASRSALPARFPRLIQTRFEAEGVGELFEGGLDGDAEVLLGEDATRRALHERAPGKRFLHVATHGWFAPETMTSTLDTEETGDVGAPRLGLSMVVAGLAPMTLCGLAFADANAEDEHGRRPGLMTAEELAGIDLSACELAVLSACETNVGIRRAGQGIQSLQAALHAAGAYSAITSLWKVDDAATRRLMEFFYGYLWFDGLGKAEALWQAKRDLREEGHPVRDWAGWVLSGDPE